jgi:hypothetical protein
LQTATGRKRFAWIRKRKKKKEFVALTTLLKEMNKDYTKKFYNKFNGLHLLPPQKYLESDPC